MELLFNDLSLREQFHDFAEFRASIGRVMEMREVAGLFGREVHCPRSVAYATRVVGDMPMQQAAQYLDESTLSALMFWLTAHGPFLDDIRQHGGGDYFTHGDDDIVTDTAVGEAAYCLFHGIDRRLVSLAPSAWAASPLRVTWHTEAPKSVDVENYWERAALQQALEDAAPPMRTWGDLEGVARRRYPTLTFGENAFEPIRSTPFSNGVAERILLILRVLHDLKHSCDAQGNLTSEGQSLHDLHFVGRKALFSDSADWEKLQFRSELTFPNPLQAGERLFCAWHGKVKTPQIRVHYHWRPISADEPVYVMYVGPKITKR